MKISKESGRLGNALSDFGDSVEDSLKGFFKKPEAAAQALLDRNIARAEMRELAREAAKEAAALRASAAIPIKESGPFMRAVKGVVKPFFSAGLWVAEQPIAFAMKPVRWAVQSGTAVFTKFPKAAPVAVVIGGAVAAGSWFANRESKNLEAQGEAIEQMQAMRAAQPQYMNNPEASQAFVDARIAADREQGLGGGSKAEAVMAARSKQPAPEAASTAAL